MASQPEEMQKSWLRLCADPRTSVELLENAAYWESINHPRDFSIRLAVARHRSTPGDLLAKLSMVNHLPLQIAVAGHPNVSESTAGELMRKQLRELRRALAGNPKIPIFVMNKLARDFIDVRVRLARNTALPTKLMKQLAFQKDAEVRKSLAHNSNLPTALLEMLSRDTEEEVRAATANHARMPKAGLRMLAEDKSNLVREAVFERAKEEFPSDKDLFRILSKKRQSLIAQAAGQYLKDLETREKALVAALEGSTYDDPLETEAESRG